MPPATTLTIRLSRRSRPAQVARQTREVVEAGGSVSWMWSRDTDFRPVAAALGDWKAPHGGMWRLGTSKSLALFSATTEPQCNVSWWVA